MAPPIATDNDADDEQASQARPLPKKAVNVFLLRSTAVPKSYRKKPENAENLHAGASAPGIGNHGVRLLRTSKRQKPTSHTCVHPKKVLLALVWFLSSPAPFLLNLLGIALLAAHLVVSFDLSVWMRTELNSVVVLGVFEFAHLFLNAYNPTSRFRDDILLLFETFLSVEPDDEFAAWMNDIILPLSSAAREHFIVSWNMTSPAESSNGARCSERGRSLGYLAGDATAEADSPLAPADKSPSSAGRPIPRSPCWSCQREVCGQMLKDCAFLFMWYLAVFAGVHCTMVLSPFPMALSSSSASMHSLMYRASLNRSSNLWMNARPDLPKAVQPGIVPLGLGLHDFEIPGFYLVNSSGHTMPVKRQTSSSFASFTPGSLKSSTLLYAFAAVGSLSCTLAMLRCSLPLISMRSLERFMRRHTVDMNRGIGFLMEAEAVAAALLSGIAPQKLLSTPISHTLFLNAKDSDHPKRVRHPREARVNQPDPVGPNTALIARHNKGVVDFPGEQLCLTDVPDRSDEIVERPSQRGRPDIGELSSPNKPACITASRSRLAGESSGGVSPSPAQPPPDFGAQPREAQIPSSDGPEALYGSLCGTHADIPSIQPTHNQRRSEDLLLSPLEIISRCAALAIGVQKMHSYRLRRLERHVDWVSSRAAGRIYIAVIVPLLLLISLYVHSGYVLAYLAICHLAPVGALMFMCHVGKKVQDEQVALQVLLGELHTRAAQRALEHIWMVHKVARQRSKWLLSYLGSLKSKAISESACFPEGSLLGSLGMPLFHGFETVQGLLFLTVLVTAILLVAFSLQQQSGSSVRLGFVLYH